MTQEYDIPIYIDISGAYYYHHNQRLERIDRKVAFDLLDNFLPERWEEIRQANGSIKKQMVKYSAAEKALMLANKQRLHSIVADPKHNRGWITELDKMIWNEGFPSPIDLTNTSPADDELLSYYIINLGYLTFWDIYDSCYIVKFLQQVFKSITIEKVDLDCLQKTILVISNAVTNGGKGLMFDLLLSLYFSDGYLNATTGEAVLGHFNGSLYNKYGFYWSEAMDIGDAKQRNISWQKLKMYSDRAGFSCESKGKMPIKHIGRCFAIISSNDDCYSPDPALSKRSVSLGIGCHGYGDTMTDDIGSKIANCYKNNGLKIIKYLQTIPDINIQYPPITDRADEWRYKYIANRLMQDAKKQRDKNGFITNVMSIDVTSQYKIELQIIGNKHSARLRQYLADMGFLIFTNQGDNRLNKILFDFDNISDDIVEQVENKLPQDVFVEKMLHILHNPECTIYIKNDNIIMNDISDCGILDVHAAIDNPNIPLPTKSLTNTLNSTINDCIIGDVAF